MKKFFQKPGRKKKYLLLTLGTVLTAISIPLVVMKSGWWIVSLTVGLLLSAAGTNME